MMHLLMIIVVWKTLTFASTYRAEHVARTHDADTVLDILVDVASGASSFDDQPSFWITYRCGVPEIPKHEAPWLSFGRC